LPQHFTSDITSYYIPKQWSNYKVIFSIDEPMLCAFDMHCNVKTVLINHIISKRPNLTILLLQNEHY